MPPLNDDRFDALLCARLDAADDLDTEGLDEGLDEADAADLLHMRDALQSYKREALRFAEQQSIAMPVPRPNRVAALWDHTPRWALATAAALTIGFTTVVATHHATGPAAVTLAAAPSAQALADDNQLLQSVDQALTASVSPSEEELGLSANPAHAMKPGRATN